jgi:ADP-heptose:LPS heptosyltransferase
MRALFKSINLIGDALYIGPALRAWIKQNHKDYRNLYMLTLNDHITPLYQGMIRDMLGIEVSSFRTIFDERDAPDTDFKHTFDVSAAFKLSDAKKQHLATSYADMLAVQIGDKKSDVKPIYFPEPGASDPSLDGCILVSMFSASCSGRDPKCNYVPNKMLPWEKWRPMLTLLREKFPNTPIRFLGADTDKYTQGKDMIRDSEYLMGIPLNRLALIMQKAKLLVTIDNGMSHLAASQETPTFLMYPKALGLHYILPIGNPNLVFVHMNPVDVDPAYLENALDYAIRKFEKTIWKET